MVVVGVGKDILRTAEGTATFPALDRGGQPYPAPSHLSHKAAFVSSVSASLHHSMAREALRTPKAQVAPIPIQSECLSGGAW